MKKLALILTLIFSILAVAAPTLANVYIGNLKSYKFHYQGCQWERKMWDLIAFILRAGTKLSIMAWFHVKFVGHKEGICDEKDYAWDICPAFF